MVTCHHLLICQHYCCSQLVITWCFHQHIHCHININFISWHTEVHWCFVGISYLAHEVIFHLANSSHMLLKVSKLLLEVCWKLLAKWSSVMKTCSFTLYVHTNPRWPWADTAFDIWFDRFLHFIFYHMTSNLHLQFLLKCTHSIYGNSHAWALWNMFRNCSHLSASRYVVFTSQFRFQNPELSCCIAIIHFLCTVNQY